MFVETVEETYVNRRWNTQQIRRKDVFKCDECGSSFQKPHKSAHAKSGAMTFCSRACDKLSRSSGALAKQWRQTKLEKYGVEHSSQIAGASEKMLATRVEKYGTTAPIHYNEQISKKWKRTMQERYGADHPLKAAAPKAKRRKTVVERFGVDPLALPENRDAELLSRAGQKGYRSLIKKRGDTVLSRPEALMSSWLKERYGLDNIDQQVEIDHDGRKSWLMDFYVRTLNVYVELDGVFWHGLDKPYDELHETKRKTFDRDRLQDVWFRNHGVKLVRITDIELMTCVSTNDWSNVISRLEG